MFFLVDTIIKKMRGKKKSDYNPRRYYYESLFERYKNLSGYYNLMEMLSTKSGLKSNETISLINGHSFNLERTLVFENFKNPWKKFRIKKLGLTIDIFIFKLFLGGYPAHLEIHMTKEHLFYFKYAFSGNISELDKQTMIEIIQNKYLNGCKIDISSQNIVDSSQTILQIEDGVNFNFYYSNLNSQVFQKLNRHKQNYDRRKSKEKEIKVEELRKKL